MSDQDAWVQVREKVKAKDQEDTLAQRLLAKAASRTLEVHCLGETFHTKWPNTLEFTRIMSEFQSLAVAEADGDEGAIDHVVKRICDVAADLVLDESVTSEVLMADDWGVEVALTICQDASAAVKEARQAVASFRR